MKRWYVIQTKSNQEAHVTQELEKQKFVVFYPKYAERVFSKKDGELPIVRTLPLFPSYIFTQFDIDVERPCVRALRGAVGFLGWHDDYLTPLPVGCVEALLERMNSTGFIPLEEAVIGMLEFSEGMNVRITTGAFAGNLATYCNRSGNRVTLLFSLLNKRTKLILPVDAIEIPRL